MPSIHWHALPMLLRSGDADPQHAIDQRAEAAGRVAVTSGRYQVASEFVREGPRLLERREAEYKAKLAALRTAAGAGVAALESGDFKEFSDMRSLMGYLDGLADEVFSRDSTQP